MPEQIDFAEPYKGLKLLRPPRESSHERHANPLVRSGAQAGRAPVPRKRPTAALTDGSRLILTAANVPTQTENAPIVGASSFHSLAESKATREQEIDYVLEGHILETFFRVDEGQAKPRLFPELPRIVREWRQGGWLVPRCWSNPDRRGGLVQSGQI